MVSVFLTKAPYNLVMGRLRLADEGHVIHFPPTDPGLEISEVETWS